MAGIDSRQTEIAQLEAAIVAQESLRGTVANDVIEATITTLRNRLAALEAQSSSKPERKQVTVLFADIVGFTALSATEDAEVVASMVNDLWYLVDKAVTDQGGRIDKHIGDAIMAVWGVHTAREDDPERAVRAALKIQDAVHIFSETHRVPLSLRIGLNTGPVLLGTVGTIGEFSAMGDTVNLASRLENMAPVDGVLISQNTYRSVQGLFDVGVQEPLAVKGQAQPLQTYTVLRARPRALRLVARGIEGIETRMVGRDDELQRLQSIYLDTAENSKTQVVTVFGEAGVGKSRLLHEFATWLSERTNQIHHHNGAATTATQRMRIGLFHDVFARRFEILESDSTEVAMAKFREGMQPVLDAERADVTGQWLGFDFSNSPAVRRLAGSLEFATAGQAHLTRYMRALSRRQPLVLLLEDIHWADDASLDLLATLATALPDSKFLIVCLARRTLLERRPEWGADHPAFSRLALEPLSRENSSALVDDLLQRALSIPDTLRELIVTNAGGNPFYAEELVKMMIDDGVIVQDGAHWQVDAARLKDHHVPPTLTNVLQARMDSLSLEERGIVQRASVVGRLFWDATVAELADQDARSIHPTLNSACKRDLMNRHDRSSFSGVLEYTFRHSLLRDVAYETVLLAERHAYHARVARWLEENAGERLGEFLDLVAEHYLLGGNGGRAADYLEQSAQQALAAGAYRPARATYERALAVRSADAAIADGGCDAYIGLGAACWQLGDYPASKASLEKGLALARQTSDSRAEANALYYLSKTHASLGDFTQAQALQDEALLPAREAGGEVLAQTLYGLGSTAWRTGDLETARAFSQECLELAEAHGYGPLEIMALNMLGLVAGAQSDEATELANYERCLELSREIGDLFREALALANLGVMALLSADYAIAQEFLEIAIDIFRDIGRQESVALNLANLATLHLEQGDLEAARRYARETLRLSQQLGAIPRLLGAILAWTEILIAEGRAQEALAIIGMVLSHPSQEFQFKEEIDKLIDSTALAPSEIEAGLAAGAELDLEIVVAGILEEQPAS